MQCVIPLPLCMWYHPKTLDKNPTTLDRSPEYQSYFTE